MGGMSGGAAAGQAPATPASSGSQALREGQYITQGQPLFEVNDLKKVWALLSVSAREASTLATGKAVSISTPAMPGDTIRGIIDLVEPVVREGQRQASVRVYLNNPKGMLKPNALVQAQIAVGAGGQALVVPTTAVWDLGRRSIVWVKGAATGANSFLFEAHEVTKGRVRGGFTEITAGLPDNAEIAKEAGLMLDSEAYIRPQQMK